MTRLATALANNIQTIAKLQDAADCYKDIEQLIQKIERCINRPAEPTYCGPCPTEIPTGPCATPLYTKPGNPSITCWSCHQTHNTQTLINNHIKNQQHTLFTAADIHTLMTKIGEPIGQSTWRRWRATGRIKPAGQLYGQDAYRLADARQLRRKTSPQHTKHAKMSATKPTTQPCPKKPT